MRCGCPQCGEYTVHVEKGLRSYCQCPNCLWKCDACMGSGKNNGALTKDGAGAMTRLEKRLREDKS